MELWKKAVAAGMMISIGATVYMACDNKVAGALLFAVGLLMICAFGMNLFTGKIGYIIDNKNHPNCLFIWLGNLIGTAVSCGLIRFAKPQLHETAASMMQTKLTSSYPAIAVSAFFCGILMYLAVENYRANPHGVGKVAGILLCVAVFILAGFEHSIADMCYAAFAVSSWHQAGQFLLFLLVVTLGNSAGALALRWLTKPGKPAE